MAHNLSTLRELRSGDLLIEGKPIFHILFNDFKGRHCDHCVQFSRSLQICLECRQMYYCDKNCQMNDWEYHQNECKVLATDQYHSNTVNWIERLLIRLWLCLQSDPTLALRQYPLIDGSKVCLNDIEVKVKEDKNGGKSDNIIDFMFEFNVICNHFDDYGIQYNREELLEWYAVIATSAISFSFKWYAYDLFIGEDADNYPALIGRGLYPQLWSVSHSCLPNAAVVTDGLSLQLRAINSVSVGTQITRSYVRLNQCKSDRKRDLKKFYLLDCNCDKCKQSLDSDINYGRYEYLTEKMETCFDFEDLYTNPKVNYWKNSIDCIKEILDIERQIYNGYHPSFTATLLRLMKAIRWWGRLQVKTMYYIPWKSQIKYAIVERHVRITYGIHHPIYRKYFTERVTLL